MTLPVVQAIGTASETAPTWPTHASGDTGYLVVHSEAGLSATPSGWTLQGFAANVAGTVTVAVFERIATSSGEGAPSINTGTATVPFGLIITSRGTDQTLPTHKFGAMGGSGAVTSMISPATKTDEADCLLLMIVAWALDNAGPLASSWANADLASVTEQTDAGTVTAGGGGLTIASGTKAGAGSIGQGTVTFSLSTQFASAVIAIRPPRASGSSTYSRGRVVNS